MSPVEKDAMATDDAEAIRAFKSVQHAIWAAGDFSEIAERNIWDVGARIVRHLGICQGEDVLDVACGTGNAALRAAKAGANVIGVDLTPELFGRARELADQAGVWMELLEGDAENLPFENESFDAVVSTFGHMFAPRHRLAASEIVRVLRPGGRFGLTAWTPDGQVGEFFTLLAEFIPEPPPFAEPPIAWGDDHHAAEMFGGTGVELQFKRESIRPPEFESPELAVDYWTTKFGLLIMARAAAERAGNWPLLRERLLGYYASREPLEYLVVLGRKSN